VCVCVCMYVSYTGESGTKEVTEVIWTFFYTGILLS
jgi:hypothetical protein